LGSVSVLVPPSVKVGGSGRQLTSISFPPRFAKKFFLAAGLPSPLSPWNLTDLPASSAASEGSPRNAFKASRKPAWDSPSSNLPSSRLFPGYASCVAVGLAFAAACAAVVQCVFSVVAACELYFKADLTGCFPVVLP